MIVFEMDIQGNLKVVLCLDENIGGLKVVIHRGGNIGG